MAKAKQQKRTNEGGPYYVTSRGSVEVRGKRFWPGDEITGLTDDDVAWLTKCRHITTEAPAEAPESAQEASGAPEATDTPSGEDESVEAPSADEADTVAEHEADDQEDGR